MICPNCGENNSANFRFCGMCGTSLEARRPAGAPRTVGTSDSTRAFQAPTPKETLEARIASKATVGAVRSSQPTGGNSGTSGPSFLGLDQPFTEGSGNNSTSGSSANESFSGLDSFFEQDEPGVSARGIILLLVLLAALGAGGWWAYTHYNGAASAPGTNSQTAAQTAPAPPSGTETAADHPAPSPKPSQASPSPSVNASPSPSPSATTSSAQPAAAPPTEAANSTPPSAVEPKINSNPPAQAPAKPAERSHAAEPNRASTSRERKITRTEVKTASRPSAAIAASGDKGDAEFKRGEAYLYGRGIPENCNEAIKNLKEASAKQNAKARSTFGTMYATGHCVPRDLPTSYSWFAQALRVDPNNQILEKDLTAVWNQMTPPERQMIAKNKQ